MGAPEVRGTYRSSNAAAIFVFVATLLAGCSAAWAEPTQRATESEEQLRVWTGGGKPSLDLQTIDQHPFMLRPKAGRTLLVHFFATWCEPCRQELQALNRLAERLSPDGLEVVTISVAEPGTRVRRFVEKYPVNFPVLLDPDRNSARAWGVTALPTTFVLDSDLQPRLFIERDFNWDSFEITRFETTTGTITMRATP